MYKIDEIMSMLDNSNFEVQRKGIELAKNVKSINVFILPVGVGVLAQHNCAKILAEKSDAVLNPYLKRLLEWVEDRNWPGAQVIFDRLLKFSDVETLSLCVIKQVRTAIITKNLCLIDHLADIIENKKLREKLPTDILAVLLKHYQNPGWWDEE